MEQFKIGDETQPERWRTELTIDPYSHGCLDVDIGNSTEGASLTLSREQGLALRDWLVAYYA